MTLRNLFSRVFASTSTLRIKPQLSAFIMSSASRGLEVEHDRNNQCFTICLDGAAEDRGCAVLRYKFTGEKEVDLLSTCAVLRYKFTGEKEVDLLSTFVPESFRGKGVAGILSKAALDFLLEEKLKAHVSCWYIKKYVEESPVRGYKDLIISDRT